MKKQNIRTLSLIVCTFTYLLIGAAIFDALESSNEIQQRSAVSRVKTKLIRKYNMTAMDFEVIETMIIKSIPHKAGYQWKFAGAFYFATTVITTIGYGHSTPATMAGKTFCMLYALAGIPLGLVMFQSIGERLNTFVAFLLKLGKRCIGMRDSEVSQTNLIMVASFIGFLVVALGAYAFKQYEKWEYFDSVYYCFITLTTIGFGDYVALQNNKALENDPQYVAFSLIFILFGLTVISAAMNLLVLRFLTMNTEDERRDEQEAKLASRGMVHLDGDIITANGSLQKRRNHRKSSKGTPDDDDDEMDTASVCSCSCYRVPQKSRPVNSDHVSESGSVDDQNLPSGSYSTEPRFRFGVRRPPSINVSHLIPLHKGGDFSAGDQFHEQRLWCLNEPVASTSLLPAATPTQGQTDETSFSSPASSRPLLSGKPVYVSKERQSLQFELGSQGPLLHRMPYEDSLQTRQYRADDAALYDLENNIDAEFDLDDGGIFEDIEDEFGEAANNQTEPSTAYQRRRSRRTSF